MSALFGPGGNSESFKDKGYKSFADVAKYILEMKLDAYEYEAGRGITISKNSAAAFGKSMKENNIALSFHSPYFISLSTADEEMRNKTIGHIINSCETADCMQSGKVVVHSGACAKMSREVALENSKNTLRIAAAELKERKLGHVSICPETMGKINQIGTLDEVIQLCLVDDSFLPCIDFGHLNARTHGGLKEKCDFEIIFDKIENKLGFDRMNNMHIHFSKIEYTAGGEKKHLTFSDTEFGPDYEPLMEIIAYKNISPVIICESQGTQAEDALIMKKYYISRLE